MSAVKKEQVDRHCDDVIIVGAGLTGYLMGLSLAEAGCQTRIIDRGDGSVANDAIRTTTINPASYDFLNSLGVWDSFVKFGPAPTEVQQIRVSDEQTKPKAGRIVADHLINWSADEKDSPLAWVFQNQQMVKALSALCHDHDKITVTTKTAITGYSETDAYFGDTAASVQAEDGTNFPARLIIAADGAKSPLRAKAKLKTISRSPGQTAIVANIKTEKPHEQMAWQRFLNGGPAALMPIDDDCMMSLVWTLKNEDAATLLNADANTFNTALMESFGTGLGALALTSERLSWSLNLQHVLKPIATRLVLAGDAAHAIHPLAGQGYNLAVGDAKGLVDIVKKSKLSGRDIGSRHGLRLYARHRLIETSAMTAMTDGLNAAFSFGGPIVSAAVGMGMTLFGATPLKSLAQKAASGKISGGKISGGKIFGEKIGG